MDAPLPEGLVPAWEEFLSAPRTLDDLFDHPVLFPLQRRREMERMHEVVRTGCQARVVVELGADKGGSVWAWLKALPTIERFIACEIRGTPYAPLFAAAFPHVQFLWVPESSYALPTVQAVREWLAGDRIDVLFIDGDKLSFVDDFDSYSPMVRRPGLVLMHDVSDREPRRAFETVRARGFRTEEIVDRSESAEAVTRQGLGIPSQSRHEDWLRIWQGRSATVGVIRME